MEALVEEPRVEAVLRAGAFPGEVKPAVEQPGVAEPGVTCVRRVASRQRNEEIEVGLLNETGLGCALCVCGPLTRFASVN